MIVVDRSPEGLDIASGLGAHHTVLADGGQVAAAKISPTARVPMSSSISSARRAQSSGASVDYGQVVTL
jgi:hypothetical protein